MPFMPLSGRMGFKFRIHLIRSTGRRKAWISLCRVHIALTSGLFSGAKRSDCGRSGTQDIYPGFGKEIIRRGGYVGQSVW